MMQLVLQEFILGQLVKITDDGDGLVSFSVKMVDLGSESIQLVQCVLDSLGRSGFGGHFQCIPCLGLLSLHHLSSPISSRAFSRFRQSSTTFTKSFRNTFWPVRFSMSARAFVPTSFSRAPCFPMMIFFCDALST